MKRKTRKQKALVPSWVATVLAGHEPVRDDPGFDCYVSWRFFSDDPVPGLPGADTPAGQRLCALIFQNDTVPMLEATWKRNGSWVEPDDE